MTELEQPTVQRVPAESYPPLIAGGHSIASVSDKISSVVLTPKTPRWWWASLAITAGLVMTLMMAVTTLLVEGVGIWGINQPVGWGFAIVNFVWWIGIGHAGTLISAILLLLHQGWRTSINRSAEAMTLFAVACAGMFPLMHLGRPWLFFWLFPYPNTMDVWPQWRSPLVWDVFAVSTYGTVSLIFWYIGLIPDLATLRDRANGRFGRTVYGLMAMGWRGAARHWDRYETAYLLLAGLATPLVLSVHTVVSFDFAVGIVPGWHSTVMPPFFVAGAIYSGFAMVLTLLIPLRALYGMHDLITTRHLQNMGKVMLATGMIVAYGYATEMFCAWYSGSPYHLQMVEDRLGGHFTVLYASLIVCNLLVPQALWAQRFRSNPWLLFIIAMFINVGMWLERYVIVVSSLSRDFLPSAWHDYTGTIWDWATYVGTIGFFLFCVVLFIRFLPMISIFEVRGQVSPSGKKAEAHE